MDQDRQPSPIGTTPSAAHASLVEQLDEEPDSPMADRDSGSSEALAATLPFDLIGPLLGRLIAVLAIAVPLLCVLADRRPGPAQPANVLPVTLSIGSTPAPLRP